MTSTPSTTNTTKTVNNKTGITTSTSTVKSGKSTTTTKTTTIGKPATTSSSSSVSTASTLPGAVLGSKWIAGPNDDGWTMCAPVAAANALLGATGVAATNGQIERLYKHAGGIGQSGVPLHAVLVAARLYGLAGTRLAGFRRCGLDDADIVLLRMDEEHLGLHSAAFAGMNLISWGGEIPLEDFDGRIIDCWALTWHGQRERGTR